MAYIFARGCLMFLIVFYSPESTYIIFNSIDSHSKLYQRVVLRNFSQRKCQRLIFFLVCIFSAWFDQIHMKTTSYVFLVKQLGSDAAENQRAS